MMILILPSSRPCPGPPSRRGGHLIWLAALAGRLAVGLAGRSRSVPRLPRSASRLPLGERPRPFCNQGRAAQRERALPVILSSATPQGTRYRCPRP
jgi:hypothetical protein